VLKAVEFFRKLIVMAVRDGKIIDMSGKDGLPAPEFFDRRHPEGRFALATRPLEGLN
jgi:hypothetical protein